ncbi:MAG TPA: hypothetical protein VL251_01860 [Thermomonas sp.]|nr:hypothetical protein [Thermomonas sp.]
MDPSPPPPAPPPRRSRAGGLLLFLLLALALAAVAALGWQRWQARQAQLDAAAAAQRQALVERVDALSQRQRAQGQRLQQAESTNRLLRDELLGIGQRAALLEDSVSTLADPDRHGAQALRLDEIELVLAIGQQRLRLDRDLDGARRALALAAPLLDGIQDPAYLSLRQTLAQERAALDALGPDPRARARALLARVEAGLEAAPRAATDAGSALPWYRRVLDRLVRVQPSAGAGLRRGADRDAALAAAQVELSLARAAVERRDAAALAQALARIGDWQRRLLADSPALPAQAGLLATLRTLPLAAESPLAGSTLQQLRALRGQ